MKLYRALVLTLLAPILALRFAVALALGKMTRGDLAERLGATPTSAARGPVVWLHGASVGELAAARGLAETMLTRDPRLRLVVTANTVTGRAQVRSWANPRIDARLAPLDYGWALRRFVGGWQPAALVSIENEIWPNRFRIAQQRRIPVLLAGARLSARSAAVWGRFPRTATQILSLVDMVAPLDAETEERFGTLGLARRKIGARMNMKAGVRLAPVDPARLAPLERGLPRDRTILAASTHPGEEEIVLAAFRKAREFKADLKLILAPRHPERGDQVATLVAQAGQPMARRSTGELPGPTTSVYLADTLGEMALWYRLACITFVGGSLVPKGGHTPFEPAQMLSAIVHGPSTENHAEAFRALDAAKAAVEIRDAGSLTAEILRLTGGAAKRDEMTARASDVLGRLGDGGAGIDAFLRRLADLTGNAALAGPKAAPRR